MEKKLLPQLLQLAWDGLIYLPPIKEQGLRNARKQFIISAIAQGRPSDLSMLPIRQLRDYALSHRLVVDEGASKKEFILEINKYLNHEDRRTFGPLKEDELKNIRDDPGITFDIFNLILLKTRLSQVFKLYLLSSKVRQLLSKNGYWRDRLRSDGFIEPKFKVISWKKWYLEVTRYSIPGEVYAVGENGYGRLGIVSTKKEISQPTRVAPLSTKHANSTGYGVIDCQVDGLFPRDGLSVFIDSFGKAYGSGKQQIYIDQEVVNPYGWNPNDPIAKQLLNQEQRAPPQPLYKVGKVDHAEISNDVIFFLENQTIKCLDMHEETILVPKYRDSYILVPSKNFQGYYSVLPPHLDGRVVYFVINQISSILGEQLIVLDDRGVVHLSDIEWLNGELQLKFRPLKFMINSSVNNVNVAIEGPPKVAVKLDTNRWAPSPLNNAIVVTDDNKRYYLHNDELTLDKVDVGYEGLRGMERDDHFILQKGTTSDHGNGLSNLKSAFTRVIAWGPNPKIRMND